MVQNYPAKKVMWCYYQYTDTSTIVNSLHNKYVSGEELAPIVSAYSRLILVDGMLVSGKVGAHTRDKKTDRRLR